MKEMKERGFKERRFQMTGKDLDAYCIYMVLAVLISVLAGLAVLIILDMTVKTLLGDLEGWARIGAAGSMLLVMLATCYGMFFFCKRRRERWVEERRVPSQGGEDETSEAA